MFDTKSTRMLEPVCGHRSVLVYDLQVLPGAMKLPFAAPEVVRRLDVAAHYLAETCRDKRAELLIWDAYRTRETQRAIFERYAKTLAFSMNISYAEGLERARSFVSDPETIFPHG